MNARLNSSQAECARAEHTESFPRTPSPRNDFDRALLRLTGYQAKHQLDGIADGRLAKMVALFDGRATIHQIRDWRKGKPVPAWAVELVTRKLDEFTAISTRLKSKTAGD